MPPVWKIASCQLTSWIVLVLVSGVSLSGCRVGAMDAATRGREVFQNCVPCHNADGSGNPQVGAPNIAGMKQWYVQAQLAKFRSGARGMHFNDLEGMRMRPIAVSLDSDADVSAVARYVESLPPVVHAPMLRGDAHAGDTQFHAVCGACHGDNAQGNDGLKAPRLAGTDDWYLATQIRKFKSGVRGNSPKDPQGRLMRPMAAMLANENAIRDMVAYIDTLKP